MSSAGRRTLVYAIIAIIVIAAVGGSAYYLMRPRKPKVIKVGAIFPLTGALAEAGKLQKYATEWAVGEINEAGGIKSLGGAKIEVVWGDTECDPSVASSEAVRLITAEKVVCVVGAYMSACTKTVSDSCEKYKTPCLNPLSTSPALTMRGLKWFFRLTGHDALFCKQHWDFIKELNEEKGLGLKTFATMEEDTEWGVKSGEAYIEYGKAAGFEHLIDVRYHRGAASLDSEVAKLKEANPDIICLTMYTPDAILFVKTMYKLGFHPKIIIAQDVGFVHPSYKKEVGEMGYWIMSREVFNWDLATVSPKIKAKADEYKAKYGVDLEGCAARTYVAWHVLALALEEAGKEANPWKDLDGFRAALRDALENLEITPEEWADLPWAITTYDGVKFGGLRTGEAGQNIKAWGIIVQMFDDGKYYTVYPEKYATKKAVAPIPW